MSLLLAALVSLAPVPIDGTRLHEGQQCFVLEAGGQAIGHVRETIAPAPSIAGSAWSIRVEQLLPSRGITFVDHFLVARESLSPIAFHSVLNGDEIARLLYLEGETVGWKKDRESGEVVPVRQPHAGVLEGNLWGPTLTAIALEEDGSYRPAYYQYHEGPGEFAIDVIGEDRIATVDGEVDVWQVAMGFSEARQTTYLIGKDNGRDYGTRGGPVTQTLLADCSRVEALSS